MKPRPKHNARRIIREKVEAAGSTFSPTTTRYNSEWKKWRGESVEKLQGQPMVEVEVWDRDSQHPGRVSVVNSTSKTGIMTDEDERVSAERLTNARPIVSVSGGKDSTAMCLHLMEMGYTRDDFDRVFMDTGWEHASTYAYLDKLEETIGPITRLKADIKVRDEHREHVAHFEERIGFESPMIRRMFLYTGFPSRVRKWCTKELKIQPLQKHLDSLDFEFVNLVGIRKEESPRRAKMQEWEYHDSWDCWVWRPLIDWKEKEVIDIHRRFSLVPNRLYLNGSTRVGCWPCISSRKKEIVQLGDERVSLIRDLEVLITELHRKKKGEDELMSTFFQSPLRHRFKVMAIDDVMSWSRTSRGGSQFEMFATEEPTCVRWGMCEHKGN
tara:strand:- start:1102 stop:2250 length:1149 start_codon:yes stop_codon:yes gene_type:complete